MRFHFQYTRSPDAEFDGHFGLFVNWKFKFRCKIIYNITNNIKCNYFLDNNNINYVTLRKFSDFCSRHTAGVAGDGIMYYTCVQFIRMLKRIKRIQKNKMTSCWIIDYEDEITVKCQNTSNTLIWLEYVANALIIATTLTLISMLTSSLKK